MKYISSPVQPFTAAATGPSASGAFSTGETEIQIAITNCPEPPALFIAALYKEKLTELAGNPTRLRQILVEHRQAPSPRSEFSRIENAARIYALYEAQKRHDNPLLPSELNQVRFIVRLVETQSSVVPSRAGQPIQAAHIH